MNLETALPPSPRQWGIRLFFAGTGLVVLGIAFAFIVGWRAQRSSEELAKQGGAITSNVSASLDALGQFSPQEAKPYLERNLQLLQGADGTPESLFRIVGSVVPVVRDAGLVGGQVISLNSHLLGLVDALVDLQNSGFRYFMKDGSALIQGLKNARDQASAVVIAAREVKNATTRLSDSASWFAGIEETIGNPALTYGFNMLSMEQTLEGAQRLFDTAAEQRIVLLIGDPREGYRPGGAVIGSYADIYFKNGEVTRIISRPVADVKEAAAARTDAPAELQSKGTWNFSDALWFFDYPASARAALQFLSHQEKPDPAPVAGVVFVTRKAYDDLATIADASSKQAGSADDSSMLFNRLAALDASGREKLGKIVAEDIHSRDLLLFASSSDVESFLQRIGADGSVFSVSNNFWGTYAGLAYGDVSGSADSPLQKQTLSGTVDIDGQGNVLTDLTLTHDFIRGSSVRYGRRSAFLELLTPPGTDVIALSGNSNTSRSSGRLLGIDASDTNILRQFEAGKTFLKDFTAWTSDVFGTTLTESFLKISSGGESTTHIRYQTPPQPGSGAVASSSAFRVVLERQPGIPTSASLKIFAPFGYIWKESQDALFNYTTQDMPGRVDFSLTLEKG